MPALLNHWRVLIETAKALGGRATPLQTLPHPVLPPHLPGATLNVWAYLGAHGPDIPYYAGLPFRTTGRHWADLMHYERTGDLPMRLLESAARLADDAARDVLLAYTLGYVTHVAADIAVHPYVNRVVAANEQEPLSPVLRLVGRHTYFELCMDEVTAQSYFGDHSARLRGAPWHRYLPARTTVDTTFTEGFSKIFAEVYGLDEAERQALVRVYVAGMDQLRAFAAGHGSFRLLFGWLRIGRERRLQLVDRQQMNACLHLAVRISVRFCLAALAYYEVLRVGAPATAIEQARAALRADLCDWDLDTGTAPEPAGAGVPGYRHCWRYFGEQSEDQ